MAPRGLLAAFAVSLLLNSGCGLTQWAHNCFKVGPNYSRPPADTASAWIDYRDPRVKSAEPDLRQWWTTFQDPVLDSLVETAYQQNLSLRVAGARVLAARALRGIAVGSLFPQVQQASAEFTRNKVPSTIAQPFTEQWFPNESLGLNASWELDLWGRFRRAIESADAELDASVEDYDNVLVVLLADVATNYVQYRTFGQQLVYVRQNLAIQTRSFQLATDKHKAGATTERDVQTARQLLEQTRALIPVYEREQRQAANRLCVLLGIAPTDLEATLGQAAGIPRAPREVAVGIPADLLRRRPDVRRSERQVAAQSARIGIAESDLYPRLSINGSIGIAAEHFVDLWDTPNSMFGMIGPAFRWDILNYGRILNNVRVQDARFQELAFNYQNTVLTAAREAEDALVAFLKAQERVVSLTASVEAAQRTVEITAEQYRQGAVDITPLYIFEGILTQQQDQLTAAQGEIALSLIAIYRSLGGGWEMRFDRGGALPCNVKVPLSAPLPCGEGDDYCGKPCPDFCKTPCTDHEKCGTPGGPAVPSSPANPVPPVSPAQVPGGEEPGKLTVRNDGLIGHLVESMKRRD